MISYHQLSNIQLDALKEVGNIGAAHAAGALSQIINKMVMISVSRIDIIPIAQISQVVGGPETETAVIQMRILGDVVGVILLVLKQGDALSFADTLKGQVTGTAVKLEELEQSALKEAGSILAASYLKAIGSFLKFSLIPSTPNLKLGKIGKIVEEILAELAKRVEAAFCIETEFKESASFINGHFLLIPEVKSLGAMLKALGL